MDGTVEKLSVIIPVYNQRKFLRQAVLSALQAGPLDVEVVIVDDASDDSSCDTVRDLPVRIFRRKRRGGPAAARNLGLKNCTGELIAFLDGDDLLLPGALEKRFIYLVQHPTHLSVAGQWYRSIDEHGYLLGSFRSLYGHPQNELGQITLEKVKKGMIRLTHLSLFLIRRELIARTGYFEESLRCGEDVHFVYRLLQLSDIPQIECEIFLRRIHDSNFSGKIEERQFIPRFGTPIEQAQTLLCFARHFPELLQGS